jgi:Spy/CpxP family protein refolding chaperone
MRTITTIALGAALVIAPASAFAQSAAENYSYKAPSGMFSEGTTKWQMYQFMAADAERTERMRAGEDVTATGSLSNSSSNEQSYPRPGERSRGASRPTSR